ncbi:MAG: hypothetical protein ACKVRP_10875 [Bacteroidota bacterium]
MNGIDALKPQFNRIQQRATVVGTVGVLLLAAGALMSTRQFFQSYLYGWLMWFGLSLGCLGVLILHHLVSGHWGNVIQRIVESGARTMALMALLFLPILIGMESIFHWTDHEFVESSHVVHHKIGYLNVPFFIGRAALYFVLWIGIAFLLSKMSLKQDQTADPALARKMKILSGPSMVVFVLSASFASVDWMMSLEPEWYSTIYGMQLIVGSVLTTFAFAIMMIGMLEKREPISEVLTTRHIHHLGNLLMAFTILWAYLAFSQFIIIWSGNLPEDNFWYIRRLGTGWNVVAVILLIGHFFVPFLLLLSRRTKRVLNALSKIAAGVFVMRLVDLFWTIIPAFSHNQVRLHWLDIIAPIAIGGMWVAVFMWQLKGKPLLPLHDPRFDGTEGH